MKIIRGGPIESFKYTYSGGGHNELHITFLKILFDGMVPRLYPHAQAYYPG